MKVFNTTVSCVPTKHYMVDPSSRINVIISTLIEQGKYFTINRARQYGKTTILQALKRALQPRYYVLSISFTGRPSIFETVICDKLVQEKSRKQKSFLSERHG